MAKLHDVITCNANMLRIGYGVVDWTIMATETQIEFDGKIIKGREMEFESAEEWNEYRLEDGSIVRVKLNVGSIFIPDKGTEAPSVLIQRSTIINYQPVED